MKTIELDASRWSKPVEFYDAVYSALDDPRTIPLPHTFGHSIDALADVMIYSGLSYLEPPYAIRVIGLSKTSAAVQYAARAASAEISRLGAEVGVSMTIVG